jgi:polysaccharide export outer membrane protein
MRLKTRFLFVYNETSRIMLRHCFFFTVILVSLTVGASFAEDYVVGEGDAIEITVYEHDDLTTTARVASDGTITFPLLRQVEVSGLTVSEISRKIASLLADGYIVSPQVNTFIVEFMSRKAVLIGEVNRPGIYDIGRNTTFLELLSKAGGLTKDAGVKAMVRRKADPSLGKKEDVITVDLKGLVEDGDISHDIRIVDGDSIHISKTGVFYVVGEVKKPDAYKYKEGTTVIKAVTLAGGFTDRAATTKVKLIRVVGKGEVVLEKVMMDEPVLKEDLIVVPLSFF